MERPTLDKSPRSVLGNPGEPMWGLTLGGRVYTRLESEPGIGAENGNSGLDCPGKGERKEL